MATMADDGRCGSCGRHDLCVHYGIIDDGIGGAKLEGCRWYSPGGDEQQRMDGGHPSAKEAS